MSERTEYKHLML